MSLSEAKKVKVIVDNPKKLTSTGNAPHHLRYGTEILSRDYAIERCSQWLVAGNISSVNVSIVQALESEYTLGLYLG